MSHLAARRQALFQPLLYLRDSLLPRRFQQQIDAGQRGGAGQWIRHKGRPVHKDTGLATGNDLRHNVSRQGCRQRQITARQ